MKRLLFLFVIISSSSLAYGQLDFAPLGATWYTRQDCPALPLTFYSQFTVTEDSIIQGKYCTLINTWSCDVNSNGDIYVHQDGYRVYIYNEYDQEFQLVYDFSKSVGESWKVKVCEEYSTDTLIVIITESSGIHRGAKVLRSDSSVLYNYLEFGEGYGTKFGTGKLLLPSPIIAEPPCSDELLCYEDPVEGFIITIDNCVNTNTKSPYLSNAELVIFPNPSYGESNLRYDIPSNSRGDVFIFDAMGRKHAEIRLNQSKESAVLPLLSPGLYIAALVIDGKIVTSEKFIRL